MVLVHMHAVGGVEQKQLQTAQMSWLRSCTAKSIQESITQSISKSIWHLEKHLKKCPAESI